MKTKNVAALMLFTLLLSSVSSTQAEESNVETYWEYAEEIGEEYSICPELIFSMMKTESSYNPNAYSEDGAIGLMQVVPRYNLERMERLGVTDLYDPYSNILVGVDHLSELAEKYDAYEALVAYNCGENSKTMQAVLDGGTWEYADEILEYSAELERNFDDRFIN